MLAKSEMLDGVAVVFDAEGVTPLGESGATLSPGRFSPGDEVGSGGMLPQKILKNH